MRMKEGMRNLTLSRHNEATRITGKLQKAYLTTLGKWMAEQTAEEVMKKESLLRAPHCGEH